MQWYTIKQTLWFLLLLLKIKLYFNGKHLKFHIFHLWWYFDCNNFLLCSMKSTIHIPSKFLFVHLTFFPCKTIPRDSIIFSIHTNQTHPYFKFLKFCLQMLPIYAFTCWNEIKDQHDIYIHVYTCVYVCIDMKREFKLLEYFLLTGVYSCAVQRIQRWWLKYLKMHFGQGFCIPVKSLINSFMERNEQGTKTFSVNTFIIFFSFVFCKFFWAKLVQQCLFSWCVIQKWYINLSESQLQFCLWDFCLWDFCLICMI